MRLWLLYMRSRALGYVVVAAGAASLGLGQLRSTMVHIPFSPETTVVDLALMAPIVPVLILSLTFVRSLGPLERLQRVGMVRLRLGHTALAVTVAELCAFTSPGRPAVENVAIGLNGLILVGIALIGSVLSTGALVWTGPLVVVALCFFFGTSTQTGSAHAWAVLLSVPSLGSILAAGSAIGAGAGMFVAIGPTSSWPRVSP